MYRKKKSFSLIMEMIIFTVLSLTFWMAVSASSAESSAKQISFSASDGNKVYATYTQANSKNDKILLLFHQAGSNRHEYDPIVPELNSAGFDTLAIDQRSGGNEWGYANETVDKRGGSVSYLDAYPDLQGALSWAKDRGYKAIITVGSSYSAALNILLASEHPHEITAIACFSPGEYLGKEDLVKNATREIHIPFYVTAEPGEGEERIDEILSKSHGDNIIRYRPRVGVHGASTLVKDRDPNGYKENLEHFTRFLQQTVTRTKEQ